jgi:hypothetical protein
VLGNWIAAETHFEIALELDEWLQAWPWLAHALRAFAAEFELWSVLHKVASFSGYTSIAREAKGRSK